MHEEREWAKLFHRISTFHATDAVLSSEPEVAV